MVIYYNEGLESQEKFMDEEETRIKRRGYLVTCIKRLTMSLKGTRNTGSNYKDGEKVQLR